MIESAQHLPADGPRAPRVLFVATVASTIEAFLLPFARYFRDCGWVVDAFASGVGELVDRRAFDNLHEARWTRRPINVLAQCSSIAQVRRVVNKGNYDIVHVHTPIAAFVTRFALRHRPRTRIVYTAHGFHFQIGGGRLSNWAYRNLERIAGRWTDRLIVINAEDFGAALECSIVPRDRLVFMPGIGIDLAHYSRRAQVLVEAREVRQKCGIAPGATVFLCIGEIGRRKRQIDVLRAFAGLQERDSHLLFAGTGPLLTKCKLLAQTLGCADRVHFLGNRRDVPALLAASNSAVLVSEREGLPRSVMEAMAMSVPVIGTRIRGTEDLLKNGGGILVPVGDIRAQTQAMSHICRNPEDAAVMGRRGSQVIQGYGIDRILDAHAHLYEELLRQAGTVA